MPDFWTRYSFVIMSLYYLHGVCFARGCLSIGKYCPIVALQDICVHQDKENTLFAPQFRLIFPGVAETTSKFYWTPYPWQSSEPQHCRIVPELCWTGTHGQSSMVYPVKKRWAPRQTLVSTSPHSKRPTRLVCAHFGNPCALINKVQVFCLHAFMWTITLSKWISDPRRVMLQ